MTAQISLQPMVTTNAAGLFNVNSAGFTQGDALDDPAVKFWLAGGVFSTAATVPLWGGVPIAETIPTAQQGFYSGDYQPGTNTLGGTIVQATAYVFTVNDAVLIRSGRSYNYKLLAYSKEEVANARRSATYIEMHEYDEHKMSNLFLSGGSFKSFFMNLWKNKDKVIHHAKQAYDIGKQAHSLYKEVKGGMPLGGYSLGGSGMKMYYD